MDIRMQVLRTSSYKRKIVAVVLLTVLSFPFIFTPLLHRHYKEKVVLRYNSATSYASHFSMQQISCRICDYSVTANFILPAFYALPDRYPILKQGNTLVNLSESLFSLYITLNKGSPVS